MLDLISENIRWISASASLYAAFVYLSNLARYESRKRRFAAIAVGITYVIFSIALLHFSLAHVFVRLLFIPVVTLPAVLVAMKKREISNELVTVILEDVKREYTRSKETTHE